MFDTEYNLNFHTPAKDRCDLYAAFDKLPRKTKTPVMRNIHYI